jgi:hypothetical protein
MRQARRLERKAGGRPPYPRVLMVCEGTETEPNYLEEIRQEYRIPTAHWAVLPSDYGTGPEQVVAYAEARARRDGSWDEVYCLFDRDEHAHYHEAMRSAAALDGKLRTRAPSSAVRFRAIPSVPCFELWFLLHFEAVAREEHRDTMVRRLKTWIPDYEKHLDDMFSRTRARLEAAYANAAEERRRAAQSGNDNPSTDVDLLVRRLIEIGDMKRT